MCPDDWFLVPLVYLTTSIYLSTLFPKRNVKIISQFFLKPLSFSPWSRIKSIHRHKKWLFFRGRAYKCKKCNLVLHILTSKYISFWYLGPPLIPKWKNSHCKIYLYRKSEKVISSLADNVHKIKLTTPCSTIPQGNLLKHDCSLLLISGNLKTERLF